MAILTKKSPLRVIHCHGCDCGVLVQFTNECPKCGQSSSDLQLVRSDYTCNACGDLVDTLTLPAMVEVEREAAS